MFAFTKLLFSSVVKIAPVTGADCAAITVVLNTAVASANTAAATSSKEVRILMINLLRLTKLNHRIGAGAVPSDRNERAGGFQYSERHLAAWCDQLCAHLDINRVDK